MRNGNALLLFCPARRATPAGRERTGERSHIVVTLFEPFLRRTVPRFYDWIGIATNLIGILAVTYLNHRVCKAFSRDEVRERVIPVYMGLVKQLDDQMGVLFDYLERSGRMEDTMIVFSSDHGDYLGDHWLGEKDLFHDASARVPLIICDPRPEADSTRGTATDALVEGIDLAPTFLEFMGGAAKPHIMEGRSLTPLLHGKRTGWRDYAISEYDYATRKSRLELGIDGADARLLMIFDGRWKYIHVEGMRPILFDLETDPQELVDLGEEAEHEPIRARLHEALFAWARRHHNRITRTPDQIDRMAHAGEPPGVLIGFWDADEVRNAGLQTVYPMLD